MVTKPRPTMNNKIFNEKYLILIGTANDRNKLCYIEGDFKIKA